MEVQLLVWLHRQRAQKNSSLPEIESPTARTGFRSGQCQSDSPAVRKFLQWAQNSCGLSAPQWIQQSTCLCPAARQVPQGVEKTTKTRSRPATRRVRKAGRRRRRRRRAGCEELGASRDLGTPPKRKGYDSFGTIELQDHWHLLWGPAIKI